MSGGEAMRFDERPRRRGGANKLEAQGGSAMMELAALRESYDALDVQSIWLAEKLKGFCDALRLAGKCGECPSHPDCPLVLVAGWRQAARAAYHEAMGRCDE